MVDPGALMATDRLQLQRLELKYFISHETALAVRDFVRCYLALDEFGANKPDLSYAIHSLYLDSDDLRTYWDTINGNKNRYKLRLRYYDDQPDSPVFFELKRRMNDAILKQRGGVRREAVKGLLRGQLPGPDNLLSENPKQLLAVQNFSRLMLDIGAKPKGHVAYNREAWVSTHDNSVRVTMDRKVRFEPQFTADLRCAMEAPVCSFEPHVILELKFTGRYPNWFRELVQFFGLRRTGAAKYADGLFDAGLEKFSHRLPLNGRKVHDFNGLSPVSRQARRREAMASTSGYLED
jgi:hypothetical protein